MTVNFSPRWTRSMTRANSRRSVFALMIVSMRRSPAITKLNYGMRRQLQVQLEFIF
jgi:hypothetical protein